MTLIIDQFPWSNFAFRTFEVKRAKALFVKMNRAVRIQDDIITCFRDGIVTLRKNRRLEGFTVSLKEIGYQGIRSGDLVIHSMDAFAGAIGVSDSDGKGSPVYCVCRARYEVNSYFFAYLLREMARNGWIQALATGIRERSSDFRYADFASQYLPVPLKKEQDDIVRFLDFKNLIMRGGVSQKQELVELMEEYKRAVIQQAVTRGLDPDVPLKPSGVEWLGDIPEHWELRRGKFLFSNLKELNGDKQSDNILSLTLRGVVNNDPDSPEGLVPHDYATYQIFSKGDLVFKLIDLENLRTSRVGLVHEDGIMSSAYIRLIAKHGGLQRYFYYQYFDLYQRGIFNQIGRGVRSTLGPSDLLEIPLLLPPVDEQKAIVRAIEKLAADIDAAIAHTRREIELLEEYRTRLIADVVTGKLDVREAAANLPDVNPDDLQLLVEGGEADD